MSPACRRNDRYTGWSGGRWSGGRWSGGRLTRAGVATGAWWRPIRAVLSVLLLAMLTACGFDGPAYGPPPTDVAAVVEMTSGLSFVDAEIRIKVGDAVEWRNRSLQAHTVTTDPVLVRQPRLVSVPEGAKVFDSGPVWPGEVYRRTFTAPGTYKYACVPHERFGMRGIIIVEP